MLVISPMWPSHNSPNYGVFVKNFVEGLRSLDFNVVHVVFINKRSPLILVRLFIHIKFLFESISSLLLLRFKLVYIHAPNYLFPLFFIFSILLNKKLIVNFHGNDLLPKTALMKVAFFINKILFRYVSGIVVPSNFFFDVLKNKNIIRKQKIHIYPSGGFRNDIFFPQNKVDTSTEVRIVCVSRMDKGKGWSDFISVCSFLSESYSDLNFKFNAIGSGPFEFSVKQLAELKGLDISFHGMQNHLYIANILRDSHILIFPSHLPESFGLCALEALSCGCLVLCYDKSAVQELIFDGVNGSLANNKNLSSLLISADKCMHILHLENYNPFLIAKTVENYSSDLVSLNLKNFLSSF